MRLIDADKLIEVLRKNSIFRTVTNAEDKSVIEIIEEQPIAYDLDKVVVKIQVQAEMQLQRGIQENEPACLYASSCYAKAAEIVKAGGIDD